MKQIYKRLFENEIPDKFEIPVINISFKELFGKHGDEVGHSNPVEFMSKIGKIVNHYSLKHKLQILSFTGEPRKGEKENKSTTRIKIYSKILSKFIKPKNIITLPNTILFLTESKKLQELDLITNVDKKSISKDKSKFVKVDIDFQNNLVFQTNLNDLKYKLFKILKTTDVKVLNNIYYDTYYNYTFIQQDENFKNGFKIFIVEFSNSNINSKTLEKYNLENSDFVKKLNSKGKLKEI